VGGSAAEPSAPSDDTLHLDRPEQLITRAQFAGSGHCGAVPSAVTRRCRARYMYAVRVLSDRAPPPRGWLR
jgi:hypothetical protein